MNDWRAKRWVKILGSDVRLDYPQKRVDEADGYHYHFEDDMAATPKQRHISPVILEDRGNGEFTAWSGGIWGCIGNTGKPKADVQLVPLRGKRDMAALNEKIASLEYCDRSQAVLVGCMRAAATA